MEKHWYKKGVFIAEMPDLLGRVLTAVESSEDAIKLHCADGVFIFTHEQGCCESVSVESIVGDLNDLIGEPILLSEEVTGETAQPVDWAVGNEESYTWTFYKLATRKGYVDIRWFGESNGYYSESVDMIFVPSDKTSTKD